MERCDQALVMQRSEVLLNTPANPAFDYFNENNEGTPRAWTCEMDAKYFREKAALCLRLAEGLSPNNPGRFQLMDLAQDFKERAEELERREAEQND